MASPCLEPRCPNLATYRGRCRTHARQREKSTQRQGHDLYRTKKWLKTRRHVLFEEPLCRQCTKEGRNGLAQEVDHIDGNPSNNDPSNLQPLCSRCHGKKTRGDQAA